MRKKDYEVVCTVIRDLAFNGGLCFDDDDDIQAIAATFADALQRHAWESKSKFDRTQFMRACGINTVNS